jgi:hypothetical protein
LVGDVDLRGVLPGQEVAVPVFVRGADPAGFAGFQFALSCDPEVLQFIGALHGPLLAVTGEQWAEPDYAPYLWAVETHAVDACVRTVGMLMLTGVHRTLGNLAALETARVPSCDGELVSLRFRLLQMLSGPLDLTVDGTFDPLLVEDPLDESGVARVSSPSVVPGALILDGIPNWWQIGFFGRIGVDPDEDTDRDGTTNLDEYVSRTDPTVPDLVLDLARGWNLVSFHLSPQDADPTSVLAGGSGGESLSHCPVFEWVHTVAGGVYRRPSVIAAQTGYWVYLSPTDPAGGLYLKGAIADGEIRLTAGWNLIGPAKRVPPPSGLGPFWSWDPGAAGYVALVGGSGARLLPTRAYWVYAAEDTVINLGR